MATLIQKWQAADNSEWQTEEKATERDKLIVAVEIAMKPLGRVPSDDGCDFANGGGYIQHTKANFEAAALALHNVAAAGPLKWWFDDQISRHGKTHRELALDVHYSWHGRMLDGGCTPVERAYSRLCCIDKATYREYGQPYFAAHPLEAEQIEMQPIRID